MEQAMMGIQVCKLQPNQSDIFEEAKGNHCREITKGL